MRIWTVEDGTDRSQRIASVFVLGHLLICSREVSIEKRISGDIIGICHEDVVGLGLYRATSRASEINEASAVTLST